MGTVADVNKTLSKIPGVGATIVGVTQALMTGFGLIRTATPIIGWDAANVEVLPRAREVGGLVKKALTSVQYAQLAGVIATRAADWLEANEREESRKRSVINDLRRDAGSSPTDLDGRVAGSLYRPWMVIVQYRTREQIQNGSVANEMQNAFNAIVEDYILSQGWFGTLVDVRKDQQQPPSNSSGGTTIDQTVIVIAVVAVLFAFSLYALKT